MILSISIWPINYYSTLKLLYFCSLNKCLVNYFVYYKTLLSWTSFSHSCVQVHTAVHSKSSSSQNPSPVIWYSVSNCATTTTTTTMIITTITATTPIVNGLRTIFIQHLHSHLHWLCMTLCNFNHNTRTRTVRGISCYEYSINIIITYDLELTLGMGFPSRIRNHFRPSAFFFFDFLYGFTVNS